MAEPRAPEDVEPRYLPLKDAKSGQFCIFFSFLSSLLPLPLSRSLRFVSVRFGTKSGETFARIDESKEENSLYIVYIYMFRLCYPPLSLSRIKRNETVEQNRKIRVNKVLIGFKYCCPGRYTRCI